MRRILNTVPISVPELCWIDDRPFYHSLLPAFDDLFVEPYYLGNQKLKKNFEDKDQQIAIKCSMKNTVLSTESITELLFYHGLVS